MVKCLNDVPCCEACYGNDSALTAANKRIEELTRALEKRKEWHKCSCPTPCDDYWIFPGGCTGRYRQDYHALRAALQGRAG